MTQAGRLLASFLGAKSAHGTTTVGRVGRNGKADSKSMIVREPLTEALVQLHIDGKSGVGAIPINEENKCQFGALDIDVYDLNHNEMQDKIQTLKLPLVHCRSKSGGAHLYLFLKDWEQAADIRDYLTEMSIALGHSGCEVFPKQDTIIAERGDVGNFINMPYFNADLPQRYAFNSKTEAMELDEFLDTVDKSRVSLSDLEGMRLSKPRQHFTDGPPCLEHLFSDGPVEEFRNNTLFNVARYCKMKSPDQWQQEFEGYNRTLASPPLPSSEIVNLTKQHEKKEYLCTCTDEPMRSYCDPAVCATRKFGIGNDAPDAVTVGGLTIMLSEPRLFFMDVDGDRIQLSTEQLQNQTLFQRACMDQKNMMPPTMKPQKWQQLVNSLMQGATFLEVPPELTIAGQFKDHLRNYCTSHVRAMSPEEMDMGKPWTDGGTTKFKLDGLLEYLHHRRFSGPTRGQLMQMIRDLGGDTGKQNVVKRSPKGEIKSTLRCWVIPAFDEGEVELPIKEISNDIPF